MFFEDLLKVDDKYSKKVDAPQYLPSHIKPKIQDLYSLNKYTDLMAKISNSNVSEDEKVFLKFAATRHIVFDYSKIADYYSHSNKEMQDLMEDSALVIIDFEDAIANGYVELTKDIYDIVRSKRKNVK